MLLENLRTNLPTTLEPLSHLESEEDYAPVQFKISLKASSARLRNWVSEIETMQLRISSWVKQQAEQEREAKVIEPLLKALTGADYQLRCQAAGALERFSTKQVVEPLIKTLQDEVDNEICSRVAYVLGQSGDSRAFEALITLLKSGEKSKCVSAAIGLGLSRDKRAVAPLVEALLSEDELISQAGYQGLTDLRGLAVEAFCEVLEHNPKRDLRQNAAIALEFIGDRRGVEALMLALKDEDRVVRYSAVLALGRFGDSRALPALEEIVLNEQGLTISDPKFRSEAARAIKAIIAKVNQRLKLPVSDPPKNKGT